MSVCWSLETQAIASIAVICLLSSRLTVKSHTTLTRLCLFSLLLLHLLPVEKKKPDFADVRAVMKDAGTALMGVGTGVGRTRAADAAVAAISSPLLDFPIQKAKRIVFNIVGGEDMGLQEINEASEVIYENADDNANIIFGALVDPAMKEEISITVLACDFEGADTVDEESTASAIMDGSLENSGLTTTGERDPNFYKDRRRNTQSPLGPDATLEETRVAITRGFKKPGQTLSSAASDEEGRGKKRKGLRKFLRKFIGSGDE